MSGAPGIETVTARAPAKLNLHLEVVGRRDDGYHDLSTVMHAIDLADELTITIDHAPPAGAPRIQVTCEPDVTAAPEENLAYRAAAAVLPDSWAGAVTIAIKKRIPPCGGLGGGSSNAACVLTTLDRALGLGLGPAGLTPIARALGADVPFFLYKGTALCEGIGDRVTPLDVRRPLRFVVLAPRFGCDTTRVFRSLQLDLTAIRPLDIVGARTLLDSNWSATEPHNRLAEGVFRAYPRLAALRDWFTERAGRPVQLTGSGSCLFAVWSDASFGGAPNAFDDPPSDVAHIHFVQSATADWR